MLKDLENKITEIYEKNNDKIQSAYRQLQEYRNSRMVNVGELFKAIEDDKVGLRIFCNRVEGGGLLDLVDTVIKKQEEKE